MRRFNTISTLANEMQEIDYVIPADRYGKYQVDTSHFVPKAEALASYRSAGDLARDAVYDFPDGKDSGVNMPFVRSHSYTGDLAELSVGLRDVQTRAEKSFDQAKIAYEREQILSQSESAESVSE